MSLFSCFLSSLTSRLVNDSCCWAMYILALCRCPSINPMVFGSSLRLENDNWRKSHHVTRNFATQWLCPVPTSFHQSCITWSYHRWRGNCISHCSGLLPLSMLLAQCTNIHSCIDHPLCLSSEIHLLYLDRLKTCGAYLSYAQITGSAQYLVIFTSDGLTKKNIFRTMDQWVILCR